jgi:putative transposase
MARKRWHSTAEIAADLAKADALAAEGRTQPEIAQTLKISVMTLHRWRKAQKKPAAIKPRTSGLIVAADNSPEAEQLKRIDELQLENGRLRKLVTDLLLGQLKLDDSNSTTLTPQEVFIKKLGA